MGIERSLKLSPGGADASRFLLSYGADERTVRLTDRLLVELSCPQALLAAFRAAAAGATFLHLGYEEGSAGPVIKAYCEFEPGEDARPLVHTAFKWPPSAPSGGSVDDYRLRADLDPAGMKARMAEIYGPANTVLADGCAHLADAGQGAFFLDVERRGAHRHSFDLRLYDGGLRLRDAEPLLMRAQASMGLEDGVGPTLAQAGEHLLGHVSGGQDDRGEGFLTVYFGAGDFA